MKMNEFKIPSPAELYALEQRARRERARAQAQLFLSAAGALKALAVRAARAVTRAPAAAQVGKPEVRHA